MWVPLHVHSQYSILDASAPIGAIAQRAAELKMPAIALTDHGNLFGAVEFYKACKKVGTKPIVGCEVYVAPESRHHKKKEYGEKPSYHLTLLAKNNVGYRNLCKLSSTGFLEGFYYNPRIDRELLKKHSEGLVCLSGCLSSRTAHEILNGSEEGLQSTLNWYLDVFGEDFYLEMQRHKMSDADIQKDGFTQETWLQQSYDDYIAKQNIVNERLITIAKVRGLPLVATNDSHYMDREDWRAHEILLNIQSGEPCELWENDSQGNPKFRIPNPKRRTYSSHECYFKTPAQMQELFQDIPEAISNTLLVADKCNVEIDFKTKHYPIFVPPALEEKTYEEKERVEKVGDYLLELCHAGIPQRYTKERLAKVAEVYPGEDPMEVVEKRLLHEMEVITSKGMSDYLLIVWDFIHWAKKNGIPVGPGRGSGAGSIVLYLIGVTDIEPLRFHLFFERFINPERLSYPDIDVDICMDKRSEVINYTLQKYGKDNVAQIITFGTMKAKMAIKDVGRVLSVPLSKVNAISKLVPDDLNITLEKALEKDPELKNQYDHDEETHRLLDLALKLEGSIRNTGVHAAGVIISGEPLTNLIPLCNAKDTDIPVTQFSMKPVEQVGMLKMDFLGLKTLTALEGCAKAVKKRTGELIDWVNLPLEDKATFDLLNQGKTMGIFQLESGGMQELARQLHIDKFEEIIAVGALYRPGPMDMIPSFIKRKHGREEIEYDHPWIKEILAETYGIMVYQEQVMQIASKLAKYSLGEGDVLRRAMGKKDHAQMQEQREKFRLGAIENGVDESVAMAVFDKMEKFASYGFNKSHAAAYGYLSYATAYMKANTPKEWMAALMTCDSADITKVAKFIRECKAMGIEMLPPDINEAGETFSASDKGIRFAMSGIKGVGHGVVEAIVTERDKNGPFSTYYDFFERIDTKKVGKKAIENLVEAGCFDTFGWTRDELKMGIEPMYETASREQKEKEAGVLSLFSLLDEAPEGQFAKPPKVIQPSTRREQLLKEKELLGFFLTGHPMDEYKDILGRLSCIPLRRLDELDHETIFRTAFVVETVKTRFTQRGQKKFAILTISDGIETQELPIWSQLYEEKGELLRENQLLYAVLQVEKGEGGSKLLCQWLDDLTCANEGMIKECDRAFDHAKFQSQRRASRPKVESKKEVLKEEKKVMPKQVTIKVLAEQTRLSHVLKIKQGIEENSGTIPVSIQFVDNNSPVATLHLDIKWGVSDPSKLATTLSTISPVIAIDNTIIWT